MNNSSPSSSSSTTTTIETQIHGEKNKQRQSSEDLTPTPFPSPPSNNINNNNLSYKLLLITNYLLLFIGSVSSTLLCKFYFNHKGSSKWVSTWVQSAGFPFLLLPIYLPYHFRLVDRKPFTHFTPKILGLSIGVGFMLGINNLLFSWGSAYLPVSTASLLLSSQLAFTLIFSIIIVKQKVTFSNLNCVVLLTLGSVLLGLGSSHDKPEGLTRAKYFAGFFCTVGAGLLFSFYLPIMEKIYRRVYCYSMVMEMQMIMELAATALATIGMACYRGFREMRKESVEGFDLGPTMYWVTVWANVVTWQLCFMGTAGMVFLTTSITGGICMTALMAINVLAGVIVYGDKFKGFKVVSTLLCVWGFSSYVYGRYLEMKKMTPPREQDDQGERGIISGRGGKASKNVRDDEQHRRRHLLLEMSKVSSPV